MHEINIHEMDEGVDGNLTFLGPSGLPLPTGHEEIERIMRLSSVGEPYIAYSYTFRLEELNGRITGSQPLNDLNTLAEHLANMSEYERIALEGAVKITGCSSIQDCIKLIHNLDRFEITPGVGNLEMLGRHFQLDELEDSLKDVPPAIMEYLDYQGFPWLCQEDVRWIARKRCVQPQSGRDESSGRAHRAAIRV